MSCRVDTSSLIAGCCVVSIYAGHGVRGDAVPSTGTHGASPLYYGLSLPADAAKEYRWKIETSPSAGTFTPFEDGSFSFIGAPSGTYSFTFRTWEDGADLGTITDTVTIGPTLSLPTVINITSTSVTPQVTITV